MPSLTTTTIFPQIWINLISLVDFVVDGDDDDELDDGYNTDDLLRSSDDENDESSPPRKTTAKRSPPGKRTTTGTTPSSGAAKTRKTTKFDANLKAPGDSTYPINDFSLTITKTKDDVGLDSLDSIAHFMELHCLKGGVSTEVGQRVFQLHLQGVLRIHWPTTKQYIQRLQKILKALLPGNGKAYKVLLKAFKARQVFSAMVGYITKDQGNFVLSKYLKRFFH